MFPTFASQSGGTGAGSAIAPDAGRSNVRTIAAMSSLPYELCVRTVESLADDGRAQRIDSGEYVRGVVDAFLEYLDDEDPRDDPLLLVDYAVGWARELSDVRLFADRGLPDEVDRQLRWCLARQGRRIEFDATLARLRAAVSDGDDDARTELVDLCRDGITTHGRWFSNTGWSMDVLKVAYDVRLVAALDASLRPTTDGRLAARRWSDGHPYWTALGFLGHLATDPLHPVTAEQARTSLADLTGYPGIGADAAVRLPAHLLGADERQRLLEALDRRERLHDGWVEEGWDMTSLSREIELIRTVLWQASDCERSGIVG